MDNENDEVKRTVKTLRTCRGQIEGIIGMVGEKRLPMDISNQIMAAQALLKRAHKMVLGQYIDDYVKQAVQNPDQSESKMNEILPVLDKLLGAVTEA